MPCNITVFRLSVIKGAYENIIVLWLGIYCNLVRAPGTESIERFTEGQASSPLYDLTPRKSSLDQRHTARLRKRDILLTGGWGKEPNHKTARKPGTL